MTPAINTGQRTCVVTGSASGIGAATVLALARAGYHTVGLDRNGDGANDVALQAELDAPGTRHQAIRGDVADESVVVAAFDAAREFLGRIDALVTSAGVVDTTPFMDISVAQFREIHSTNVIGTFLCMREAARHMRTQTPHGPANERGVICAIASIAGLRGGGLSGTAAYAASKGGVIALAKNAARVLAVDGIRVNTLSPGATDTPMIDEALQNPAQRERIENLAAQKRLGQADEIASGVLYLISPQASFTHGANLVIDGGIVLA
jgi:3-oxoacyl-[acyl-carrier protein] reductase